MRDPKRIREVVKLLEKVWKKFPEYRLGQLLENVSLASGRSAHECVFYIEDDEWVRFLKEYAPEVLTTSNALRMLKKMDSRIKRDEKRKKNRRKKFVGSGYKFPECLMPGGGKTGHGDSKVDRRKKPSRKGKTARKKTR